MSALATLLAAGALVLAPTLTAQADVSSADAGLPAGPVLAPGFPEAWGDFDADGFDDVYVLSKVGDERLLRNLGTGGFEDVTALAGLSGRQGSRQAEWFDFDHAGGLDLLIVDAEGGLELHTGSPSGRLDEVTPAVGLDGLPDVLHGRSLDYDGDGWADLQLMLTDGRALFLHNLEGRFLERFEPVALPVAAIAPVPAGGAGTADGVGAADPRPGASRPRTQTSSSPMGSPTSAGFRPALATVGPWGGVTPTPAGPLQQLHACAASVHDQAGGGCLKASSVPTLGLLYPLSTALNVDMNGRVGMGTIAPAYALDVVGTIAGDDLRSDNGLVATTAAIGSTLGVGTSAPVAPVQVLGGGDATLSGGGFLVLGDLAVRNVIIDSNEIMARDNGGPSPLYLNFDGGDVVLGDGTFTAAGNASIGGELDVAGWTRTFALEIHGGADVAEPFEVRGDVDARPGFVVAIDPDRLGELRIADRPYDRTVAGIISGANGVRVGLMLSQQDSVADGSHPVALTGRVWCWADADAGGPIAAGDLLTSSSTPGHAMRAGDATRAPGAVLGKAMSSLDAGRGLVLVLVSLQ